MESTPDAKADLGKRFLAYLIDCIVAILLSFVIGFISSILGGVVAAVYFVVRDGLDVDFMKQRSLGKQFMKLEVVRLDGQPVDLVTSLKRNWMFGLGAVISILAYIPILGWVINLGIFLVAIGIVIYEIIKVLTDKEGRRWGDQLAGTKVIHASP